MTQPAPLGIWQRPAKAGRGPVPEYSRTQLAKAGIALADASGLTAVTMRAVATAVGAGPASLYRYVATRDELLELMIDEVNGEFSDPPASSGDWLQDLLALAQQSRAIYLRHPWLLNALESGSPLGPNAVAYLERSLAMISELEAGGRTKLEAIGVFNAVIRLLVRAEVDQQSGGQSLPQWQAAQASYLSQVVTDGQHPHLAAALSTPEPAGTSEPTGTTPSQGLFNRVLTRVLTGLLVS